MVLLDEQLSEGRIFCEPANRKDVFAPVVVFRAEFVPEVDVSAARDFGVPLAVVTGEPGVDEALVSGHALPIFCLFTY